jgi:hypothetical protein
MSSSSMIDKETGVARAATPMGVRWLLPSLTLLLAALAAYQLVYLVPRCIWLMQNLGVREPGYLRSLLLPSWAAPIAALALSVIAWLQRGSATRSALLALLAVGVNVGCNLCIVGALSQILSHAQSP